MELLLDTHAFLWWLAGDQKLTVAAQTAIADAANAIYLSAASVWEISTKHRLGKLPGVAAIAADMDTAITAQAFKGLPISVQHAQFAGALPGAHRDPFDRMLIAQSILEGLLLVSNDTAFDDFGVKRLW